MRIPVILQSDRAECGLACLAMVAAFHGHRETLREYRSRFHVSQRGGTLANLRDYAEQLGFQCRAVRAELDELPQLRRPAILHWDLNHFVVLKAAGRNSVRIVDPAVGTRRLSIVEASERFTGVAMELMPTMELKRRTATESVGLKSFLPAFRGLGASLGATFVMTLALQAFGLAMPLHTQFTVDQGIRQGDMNIVVALAVGFGLVGLVSATTQWLRTLLVQYVGNTLAFRMMTGLAHHLLRLPDSWFVARHPGDVISRFASTTPVGEFLMTGAFAILVDLVMAIGALAILFAYAWNLALVLCAFLSVLIAVRFATFGHLRNLTHEMIAAEADQDSSFIENVERHRAIKLLGAEGLREDAWGERYVRSINAGVRLVRFGAHIEFGSAAIGSIQTVVMLMLGASNVIDGTFTLGMLFAFSSYSGLFSARAYALIESLVQLRMLRLHQERIADIALEKREIPTVRRGSPQDMSRVEDAARMACIHGDIERMPMQYLTLIGHMGSTLSGGQRQRVMIARAIYRRPALILLDEGTAHLNNEIQQRVLDSLRETGATMVAATHDERVLERADRRISLAAGR